MTRRKLSRNAPCPCGSGKRYDGSDRVSIWEATKMRFGNRVENEKLEDGDYPSDQLICRLAKALDADVDELLILFDRPGVSASWSAIICAEKIPPQIRRRVLERPDA